MEVAFSVKSLQSQIAYMKLSNIMDDQKEGTLCGSMSGMALMAMRQNLMVTRISSKFFFAPEIS